MFFVENNANYELNTKTRGQNNEKNEERIIFNITIMSGKDSAADLSAKNTYQQLNLSLNVDSGLPNLDKIRTQCLSMENADGKCIYTRLSAYIENRCHSAKKANTLLNSKYPLLNLLFNIIEPYRRKNIRISLYPGDRNCISGLNMRETTHNMIIQFDKNVNTFVATEPHNNPPSFYQVCSNEETALLYIEALLVDSCMCHYLAISEAAYFHDKQQEISKEKVEFIRYIYESDKIDFLSSGAKRLCMKKRNVLRSGRSINCLCGDLKFRVNFVPFFLK